MKVREVSLDIETSDPLLDDTGPSWTHGQGKVLVTGLYDVAKKRAGYIDGAGGKTVREMFTSASTTIIGAKVQYDAGWLVHEHGLDWRDVKCNFICVQIAESLVDQYQPFKLDDLAWKYLKERKGAGDLPRICASLGLKGDFRKHLATLWEKGEKYRALIRNYCVSDADQPARIWEKQKKILEETGQMEAFIINMKMLKAMCKAKARGVRIDYERWQHNCKVVKEIHDKLSEQFHRKYGEVNLRSPKQMGEFMTKHNVPFKWRITVRGLEPDEVITEKVYKKTGIKKITKKSGFKVGQHGFEGTQVAEHRKKLKDDFPTIRIEKDKLKIYEDDQYKERTLTQLTAKGYNVIVGPCIDKYFLLENKHTHPIVADLVEYKQVKDIISKFLGEKFGRYLVYHKSKKEWRLHANFNPVGARQTGRLSSNGPNLQNIPSKTVLFAGTEYEVDLSVMCREIFLPEKGHIFVKLDFSGQENRLQAHFAVGASGRRIRKMYRDNPRLDEHKFVGEASGLVEEFGPDKGRKFAKNVRFGLSYGMQLIRMCLQFGWVKDFAQKLSDAVKDASPWFVETMEEVQAVVRERGYIITLLGRRIWLKGWKNMSKAELAFAKVYAFYNYLIQGSASDQTKACQVACDETETEERLLLTVHDEGDFSLPMTKAGLARLKELVRIHCETLPIDVPVICDPELGTDWAHLEGQKLDNNGYPTETIDELWERMCKIVESGERAKPRIFDLADIEDLETDEDEEEDEDVEVA